jgi:hypothetical protein
MSMFLGKGRKKLKIKVFSVVIHSDVSDWVLQDFLEVVSLESRQDINCVAISGLFQCNQIMKQRGQGWQGVCRFSWYTFTNVNLLKSKTISNQEGIPHKTALHSRHPPGLSTPLCYRVT